MKVIISPAKKMNIDSDTLPARSQPVFSDEASQLAALLRALTPAERQKIWQCSDKLAAENSARRRRRSLPTKACSTSTWRRR